MILERETFEKFGYWPKSLKSNSNKHVMYRCAKCGKSKARQFGNYNKRKSDYCFKCKNSQPPSFVDLTGKVYGALTVIKREIGSPNWLTRWLCVCKCGSSKYMRASVIRGKKSAACSTSCPYSLTRKGCKSLTGSHWARIKQNARKRKIPLEITAAHAFRLFLKQQYLCALSGEPLSLSYGNQILTTASLDRIVSRNKAPYKRGNVQWVDKEINRMKGPLSDEEFIRRCTAVVEHAKKKKLAKKS